MSANDSAHRWRPLRDSRIANWRRGAAIRWSAWFGEHCFQNPRTVGIPPILRLRNSSNRNVTADPARPPYSFLLGPSMNNANDLAQRLQNVTDPTPKFLADSISRRRSPGVDYEFPAVMLRRSRGKRNLLSLVHHVSHFATREHDQWHTPWAAPKVHNQQVAREAPLSESLSKLRNHITERPELRHAGRMMSSAIAELDRPSRVACSDLLDGVSFISILFPNRKEAE
jgi:hypothetical protein